MSSFYHHHHHPPPLIIHSSLLPHKPRKLIPPNFERNLDIIVQNEGLYHPRPHHRAERLRHPSSPGFRECSSPAMVLVTLGTSQLTTYSPCSWLVELSSAREICRLQPQATRRRLLLISLRLGQTPSLLHLLLRNSQTSPRLGRTTSLRPRLRLSSPISPRLGLITRLRRRLRLSSPTRGTPLRTLLPRRPRLNNSLTKGTTPLLPPLLLLLPLISPTSGTPPTHLHLLPRLSSSLTRGTAVPTLPRLLLLLPLGSPRTRSVGIAKWAG